MAYRTIHIDFEDIARYDYEEQYPVVYSFHKGEKFYEIYVNRRPNSRRVVAFGSGAITKETVLPVFSRVSWANAFDCNVIGYADPGLYEAENATLTWYYGHNDEWYLETIAAIMAVIFKKWRIPWKNVHFSGSSGGGYSSAMLAVLMRGSTASAINPQLDISTFSEAHYTNFVNDMCDGDMASVLEERMNIISLIKRENYAPFLHILQNAGSSNDIVNQIIPFINDIQSVGNIPVDRIIIEL